MKKFGENTKKVANSIVGGSEMICKQIKSFSKNVHILLLKYPSSEGLFPA